MRGWHVAVSVPSTAPRVVRHSSTISSVSPPTSKIMVTFQSTRSTSWSGVTS
ncbi:hypothetical protein HMPREF9622_00970 [Cutibacterium modestum HL037PA3]|uniref:Uncharacterized protein n=1 Tax=Cutibacterium modestum HL044PA1 TaxID=765109 RepID=A0ABP2K6A2_9ACTN|nr:hypothetical protein HMPREF9607_02078 [Cutibacterium modestum HL044PA1]EFT16109.1 hypothetical protein HMPREF9622_00970 [Cutibacterium modestum HL037PA3]